MPFQPSWSASSTYASRQGSSPWSAEPLERGERVVAAVELVGQDVGELARQRRQLVLVALDLDERRQQRRRRAANPRPFRRGSARRDDRVEVSGSSACTTSSALMAPRGVVERPLVEHRRACGRSRACCSSSDHDLELALESLGHTFLVVALLFELGDFVHAPRVFGIDLVEDEEVARDGAFGVVERFGEQLGLAQRDFDLRFLAPRERDQADARNPSPAPRRPDFGVVGQLEQNLGVVAVLERLEQRLARGVFVVRGDRLNLRCSLAQARALLLVVELFGAGEEWNSARSAKRSAAVYLLSISARVCVVVRVELARALDVEQRIHLVARLDQHAGCAHEQRGASPSVRR